MTRPRASQKAQSGTLYISGSTYHRVPIFRQHEPCEIFLRALEAYRQKFQLQVFAFAVMPDHYHLLLEIPAQHRLLDFLRDFKSLVGKQALDWVRQRGREDLLRRFSLPRKSARSKDARYCVLQYNAYVKALDTPRALRQKLAYIHMNPVRERLAESPEAYPYSSARTYADIGSSLVKIDRLRLPYD